MTTNYDPITNDYQASKQQRWRIDIESFNLMKLVGDPHGLNVLDMACGEGFYTRKCRRAGANRVVGIDLSEGMISLAQEQEELQQLGIEYHVADARSLDFVNQFDLVVAAYLLNYARTADELESMCAGIARSLKPGGRFVTVNSSPWLHYPSAPSYRKYGFEAEAQGDWLEGVPVRWTFYIPDGKFDIENYYLDGPTHERALRAAGFRSVRWQPAELSPEAAERDGTEFWADFLHDPPIAFLECGK